MRISDWSSDVCSSDLPAQLQPVRALEYQSRRDLVGALRLAQLVDEAADLACIAAGLGRALLAVVQLLDHLHRLEYVVFLELEQRRRVIPPHVCCQNVDAIAFFHCQCSLEASQKR